MKIVLLFLSMMFNNAIDAQVTDKHIRDLKSGRVTNDTSYVYLLPFAPGAKHFLVQAYNSKFSHRHELALDFKMKVGNIICAAREGVVTASREDSDKGGLKDEYLSEGNYVIIRHNDGSSAQYWHFKKDGVTVKTGDTVKRGQLIGYSGNTGYTAFPHLHFQVVDSGGQDLPTRFETKQGIRYLRPGNSYKRPG